MKLEVSILMLLCSVVSGETGLVSRAELGAAQEVSSLKNTMPNPNPADRLRLSMLFESLDGTMCAGIIDASNQKSFILYAGQTVNGFELIKINMTTSEALMQKDHKTFRLKLTARHDSPALQPSLPKLYLEHRRRMLEKIGPPLDVSLAEFPARLSDDEMRRYAEKIQMDAIRKGDPPFPHLPFTIEMDQQLIKEGVLPSFDDEYQFNAPAS